MAMQVCVPWLRRFVSRVGLRAIDTARVHARYRGLPGSQSGQAFSHGIEGHTSALDAVGCIEPAGLAHLSRTGDATIVRARELYAKEPLGIDLDATVYALDATTHRSMLEFVRLGAVSFEQGDGEDALLLGLRGFIAHK